MIKLTDLAAVLVEKAELTKREADFFIPLFIDVLTTGLKSDKQVKIKGLGTFKVTAVSPRESVDVNTGERIIIEGRDKISFTPEVALRDRVNAPFEQFETVTISDDADFSEIDERYQAEENTEEQEDTLPTQPTKEEKQVEEQLPQQEVVTDSVDAPSKEMANEPEEKQVEPLVERSQQPESSVIVAPMTEEKKEEASENCQNTSDKQSEEIPTFAKTDTEKVETTEAESDEIDEISEDTQYLRKTLHRTQRNQKLLIGAVCCLLLLMIGSGLYVAQQFSLRDHRIEHLMAELISAKKTNESAVKETPQMDENADQQDNNTIEQTNQTDGGDEVTVTQQHEDAAPVSKETSSLGHQQATTRSANRATSAEKTQETQTKNRQYASKYDADPRIRTGAYAITGIAQTVTVRPGQTLSSISRAYLGPGMECYMEAVNDKAELKAGDKVKIPALKLKKKMK
jgi:hypothetical protein